MVVNVFVLSEDEIRRQKGLALDYRDVACYFQGSS